MKDCVTIQKELHDKFSGLSEAEQIAAASAIFGKNQMSKWLALINTAPEDVQALDGSLKNCAGTTDEMSSAMMDGFGGSIEKLKSSIDVLMTKLGQLSSRYLQPVVDKAQQVTDKFLSMDEKTQDLIVRTAGIVAAIGPVLAIGGRIITLVGIQGGEDLPVMRGPKARFRGTEDGEESCPVQRAKATELPLDGLVGAPGGRAAAQGLHNRAHEEGRREKENHRRRAWYGEPSPLQGVLGQQAVWGPPGGMEEARHCLHPEQQRLHQRRRRVHLELQQERERRVQE